MWETLRRDPIRWLCGLAVALLLLGAIACGGGQDTVRDDLPGGLTVTSSAFADGAEIPVRYTCQGENVSPPLAWEGIPENTAALVLLCEDPDAPLGTYSHWVVYDLPADTSGLPEAVSAGETLPGGGIQGLNDFGDAAYGGPCPPSGEHHYYWTLYALDEELGLAAGAKRGDVLQALEGHVLATGQLMGRYQKTE